ncbi:MAG: hypothetical protein K6348_00725, partial [Deferribacterales bacterium]
DDSRQIKELLKLGYFDYLFFDYSEDELALSILDAIENKRAFEKISMMAAELGETNRRLLEKNREIEKDKKLLQDLLNKFRLLNNFLMEINNINNIETIGVKVIEYLAKEFIGHKIIFTKIDDFKEYVVSVYGNGLDSLKNRIWDLKDLNSTPWAESILRAKVVVDIPYPLDDVWYVNTDLASVMPGGFIKFPISYSSDTYGSIVLSYENDEKFFREDQLSFIKQILELVGIRLYNISITEKLSKTIEQLKDLQSQAIEKEKLSTLAKVAVSVNHEINNPLCAISLNTELIKRKYKDDEYIQKVTDAILKNVIVINKITNKFANLRKVSFKEYLPGIEMLDLGDD